MKKLIAILLTLSLFSNLYFLPNKVKAEEVEEPTTEEVIEVVGEKQKSKLQLWYDENFGWIWSGSLGLVIVNILEIIVLSKKSKLLKQQTDETEQTNTYAKTQIDNANKKIAQADRIINKAEEMLDFVKTRMDGTDKLLGDVGKEFSSMKTKLANLEESQKLIACNSKELVTQGAAEKIVKLLEGTKNEETEV